MKNISRFFFHMARNILLKNHEYLRIIPNETRKISSYDQRNKKFFLVMSRNLIDYMITNQIYTNNEYNFSFICRRDSVKDKYEEILTSGIVPFTIDYGANIGLSAQYFVHEFSQVRIVVIEPDADNLAAARRNCADFPNIEIIHAAIGSENGLVAIEDSSVDANAFRVTRTGTGSGIRVRTIPDLVAEVGDAALFMIGIFSSRARASFR